MPARGHHKQGIFKISFPGSFLYLPDFVQTLSTDASRQMSVELSVRQV